MNQLQRKLNQLLKVVFRVSVKKNFPTINKV